MLWPIYHARNGRLKAEAVLSTAVLTNLNRVATEENGVRTIVLLDAVNVRPSLRDSFGTLTQEAVDVVVGRQIQVRLEPLAEGEVPTDAMIQDADLVLRLTGGRLTVVNQERR